MTGRFADALTDVAARAYPRSRRTDARVVRDCAREAIAADGLWALARESASLVTAGLRARTGVAALELRGAPWRAALGALTFPLATVLLLMWTFGFVPHYDHWPLGYGWILLLGGSLCAVVGAALRSRWLTAGGAAAVFVAAATPYLGHGTESGLGTATFFDGWHVDLGAASILPTLLLAAGGLSLPRGRRLSHRRALDGGATRPSRTLADGSGLPLPRGPWPSTAKALIRLAAGLIPSVIAAVALIPYATPKPTYGLLFAAPLGSPPVRVVGAPYAWPWIEPSRAFIAIFGILLAVAVIATWWRARARPGLALATALVLASIAYPLTWVITRSETLKSPYWRLNGHLPLVLTVVPVLLALALVRRASRKHAAAPSGEATLRG
ncbi:MAG TPA: hypothetical protein VGM91_02660 [Conexibacter sp.]|jgi:hypothetical protein